MEFPKPTIDVARALHELLRPEPNDADDRALSIAEAAAGIVPTGPQAWVELKADQLKALLAQAWEEGRWSPPGATLNPYGEPAQPLATAFEAQQPGAPLLRLRAAAQAALAWIENMAPTVRRTALAEQLRSALGGK
jgi:hypothetical protein